MTEYARKPNLFVIGAMKCGSTSLHEYLNTHPRIAMSQHKEPGYFVEELTMHRGEQWYLSLFDSDERYSYIGESSTHYTKLPVYKGVPERLYRFNPSARLIYIMRNPLNRALSHYWHNVRVRDFKEGGGEPRPLLKAIREQPAYLAFSDYATQLEPYIDRFGRQSVYAFTFESLIADPQREIDKIYHWLDLQPHPLGNQVTQAHNKRPEDLTVAAGAGILYRVEFSNAWNLISPYVPDRIKRWAKARAHRRIGQQQMSDDVVMLRDAVGDLQRKQIQRLSLMLGRDFPEWTIEMSTSTASYVVPKPVARPLP